MMLNVNEIFGPTIQGEGPAAGRRATFLRLAGCNLDCGWCDTPYSWDWKRHDHATEVHQMPIVEVFLALPVTPLLIVTGGEPLLQQRSLGALFDHIPIKVEVHIETNGTVRPEMNRPRLYVVSPKLASANVTGNRENPKAMETFSAMARRGRAIFKFVVVEIADLLEVRTMLGRYTIPDEAVWIMPEGADSETHLGHLRAMADRVVDEGWNLTTRLHVLAWGQERAR